MVYDLAIPMSMHTLFHSFSLAIFLLCVVYSVEVTFFLYNRPSLYIVKTFVKALEIGFWTNANKKTL